MNSKLFFIPTLLIFLASILRAELPLTSLDEAREIGRKKSTFLKDASTPKTKVPQQQLDLFRTEIAPVLKNSCVGCHGEDLQEGKFRVDTLDPDLVKGEDVNWWLEVSRVLTNGEMPPADEGELAEEDRAKIINWLANEIQIASQIRRNEEGHSSFRRMTRYEYSYALQDLLGLPYDFGKNLPPESSSEEGFKNSSKMLHLSARQFETYRDAARTALSKATVSGEQPKSVYYGLTMKAVAEKMGGTAKPDEFKRRGVHLLEKDTGAGVNGRYAYNGGKYSFLPTKSLPEVPKQFSHVMVLPAGPRQNIDLGNFLPASGTALVRVRASKSVADEESFPTLRLSYGHQASNNSHAFEKVGADQAIHASPDQPEWYEWEIPLSEVIRNPFRTEYKVGGYPNPTEYLVFQNMHQNGGLKERADIHITYIEVIAPYYPQWPPASHRQVFPESAHQDLEPEYAGEVLSQFMTRAWRGPISDAEVQQKLELFQKVRPHCDSFEEAMIEVLAAVLSSPRFLYLVQTDVTDEKEPARLDDYELATRLSMFLWCSVPDDQLLTLAEQGKLHQPEVLISQAERMLANPKAARFSEQFVRQWLGMELLDYLQVDKKAYRQFSPELKDSMQQEPVAFFEELLKNNSSVIDFLHADYVMVNERLARHYGIREPVYGNHFRKVEIDQALPRGGLLTQAGLLAMNSDGKDSHPLKRGIWLLESLLNDPPPPPPPAVPEIDLADPEILKMTLKERMEDHRSDPACYSCHARIDPWGIAFENFDAIGSWRDKIKDKPVDASSELFNQQKLNGIQGLKEFLLANRQDQFTRALVHKLTAFALGRPPTFADRSDIDEITTELRQQDDGLKTLVTLIVTSDLFLSK